MLERYRSERKTTLVRYIIISYFLFLYILRWSWDTIDRHYQNLFWTPVYPVYVYGRPYIEAMNNLVDC